MARLPRTDIAGIPQHVVQRGNNRKPCFLDDDDRQRYLVGLRDALRRFDCALHAYLLMSNHVHLLVTQNDEKQAKTGVRVQCHYFKSRHPREGGDPVT